MKNMTRWLAVLAVSLAAFSAAAQTYPRSRLKIVVGFARAAGPTSLRASSRSSSPSA